MLSQLSGLNQIQKVRKTNFNPLSPSRREMGKGFHSVGYSSKKDLNQDLAEGIKDEK